MNKPTIDMEKNTTAQRFLINDGMIGIKKILFESFTKHEIKLLLFDENMYKTNDRIFVIPATIDPQVHQVIGFELKTDRGTKELQLLYIQDNQLKRCFTFETLNEQSIWWDLSRVVDWYNSNVWKQE